MINPMNINNDVKSGGTNRDIIYNNENIAADTRRTKM